MMHARLMCFTLMLAFMLPGLAAGHEFTYTALLTGPAQFPPNASSGFGMADGKTYLNIQCSSFPGGEIRGFLIDPTAVPEPGTMALCGMAGLVVATGVWYRRRSEKRFARVA